MDERIWTNRGLAPEDSLQVGDVRITRETLAEARLVSGDLKAAIAALAPGVTPVGLVEETGCDVYALRIARDRMLLCSDGPRTWPDGWQTEYALSRAEDLYVPLRLSGLGAEDVLAQISGYMAGQRSPSAAVRLGHHVCLIARNRGDLVLFVEPPSLPEVTSLLRGSVPLGASEQEIGRG